jgi:hypothetical protein
MCFDFTLIVQIGGFFIACITLWKGIYEYSKAQTWKKSEFVSKEIKEFQNDFDIKRAFILLDWNYNEIQLKENEIDGINKIEFDDALIFLAMVTHKQEGYSSTEEIKVIKFVFDAFFDRLVLFNNYIKTGLIKVDDIKPYLIYWISILADYNNDRKEKKVRDQIWKYIDEYEYVGVRELCNRFGFK